MKKIINILCFFLLLLLSTQTFSQGPGQPYHPMTAPGAKRIFPPYHTLYWENRSGTVYNKVYLSLDSAKVATMDASALILDGYPNIAYTNANLTLLSMWAEHTIYYWMVVEYNSTSNTLGPVWYFKTLGFANYFEDNFNNGMDNWQIVGPNGLSNWSIVNSSNAGGSPPELKLSWTPPFVGISYIMCNFELSSEYLIMFNHFVDWYGSSFQVGVGYTVNSGNSWNSVWEISPTGNVGPELISWVKSDALDDYKIGFYLSGDSYGLDYWYIDNVFFDYILTPPPAIKFIKATADSTQLRVYLDIIFSNSDSNSFNSRSYPRQIVRKTGLPQDTAHYVQIAIIPWTSNSYIDEDIFPNEIYTYKVRTVSSEFKSKWCNEATAYVPNIVPVELQSFTSEVIGSDVKLLWSTATETNNSGFEILRNCLAGRQVTQNDSEWESIGFVPGFGTTTEVHHYSFVDESVQSGNYQYRLKQTDFDGTIEYSNIIEVTIDAPTKFSLEQNYPNPFNPTTKIKFEIPSVTLRQAQSDITVTLKVFDLLGNKIATLVNEQKPAGTYEVEFNVAQVSRPELSSGIYFYQLKAGEFTQTKKMLLLK